MADTAKIEALMRSAAAASAPTTFMDGIEERMQKIGETANGSAPVINAHKQTEVTPVRDPETAKAEGNRRAGLLRQLAPRDRDGR